ncbi:hypothetical protein AB4Z10_18730 [Bosea sp. RAF48]|uniref:hypothetical protein n=1 Tax=Bosea sp. RAF48 TaxID=3237480 RepID=UPI003F8E646C
MPCTAAAAIFRDGGWLRRTTRLCALAALAITVGLVLLTLGARPDFTSAWTTLSVIAKAALSRLRSSWRLAGRC